MGEPAAIPGRLVWRCRRGMKELDLVLTRYLEQCWQAADAGERSAFERMLQLPDPVLAALLLGHEPAPDADLQRLLERVRGC
jgi:antitoxin CptB